MTGGDRVVVSFLGAWLCAAPTRAWAGDSQPGEALVGRPWVDQFLDIMYLGPRFSRHAENGKFDLFESQVAPHLYFFQSVEKLLTAHEGWNRWNGWTAEFVPLIRMRMTGSASDPVRTASFNPQFLTVQKLFTWGANFEAAADGKGAKEWRWPTDGRWVGLLSVQYTIAHHSNGQDGCTFKGTGTVDPNCTPADFSKGAPQTNTLNGNYGTNYETLGVHHKWFQLDDHYREARAHEGGISWERYEGTLVSGWLPGGLVNTEQPSRDFQRIFGKHRVTGHYEYEQALPWWAFERVRARAEATWISPASDVSSKARLMIDTAWLFRDAGGFGLFSRVFWGQDYYNIRLEDVGWMGIIGITWDSRALQVFRPAPSTIVPGEQPPPPRPGEAERSSPIPASGEATPIRSIPTAPSFLPGDPQ